MPISRVDAKFHVTGTEGEKKQDTSLTLLSVLNKRIEDVRYDLSLDKSNFHCSVVYVSERFRKL